MQRLSDRTLWDYRRTKDAPWGGAKEDALMENASTVTVPRAVPGPWQEISIYGVKGYVSVELSGVLKK